MAEGPLPSDLNKVDPESAWRRWQPPLGGWNRKWAAHLFRRAAFGASPAEIDAALKDGPTKTIDRLMTGEPDAADRLDLLTETGKFYTDATSLRTWWLYAMFESGHPLREKLTLFWHNHFATSQTKVRATQLMYEQNVTLRKHALGKFRPFLLDVSRDVAMLVWLDSNRNVKGAPNENYSREMMELFSLGVGKYTEKDIQEAARAFTGWHHDAEVRKFEFNAELHDDGQKTVFGKTGKWTGEDIVQLCCDHEACTPFLVGKLYAYLVSETAPPKGLLAPLVERFEKSNYDIAVLVRAMIESRMFFSDHAYRKRVKWPVECAVGAVRSAVRDRVPLGDVVDPVAKMGQALFSPPNVKGWRTGTDWLNSATLLARNNFTEKVALGQWNPAGPRQPKNVAFAPPPAPIPPPGVNPDALPPAPEAKFDVCAPIFATKPKDIAAVIQRMGELLYGEPIPAGHAKRIEKFLLTPAPAGPVVPGPIVPGTLPPAGPPGTPPLPGPPPGEQPKPVAKEPPAPPKPLDPKDVKLDAPDFRARVREALHALMCLPEYQLS